MEGKKGISEDWLSLWIGLCIFVLGLGLFAGLDLLGWGVKTSVWTDITKALSPVSGTLKGMPGLTSLLLTYVFMLVIMEIGAIVMGVNVGRFMLGFTLVFWIGFGCWLLGHFGYIAATDAAKAGIGWSLKLTGEAGFIVALIVGLIVGNFFTKLAGTRKRPPGRNYTLKPPSLSWARAWGSRRPRPRAWRRRSCSQVCARLS